MTYCIGLRTERGVFIAADSVLSGRIPFEGNGVNEKTTFGEVQGVVGNDAFRYMSEEGVKVCVKSDTVSGFAGDVNIANSLIDQYFAAKMIGMGARDSVRSALMSITPCEKDADVLFAFYEDDRPCLLLVNTLNGSCHDVEGLVQLGSESLTERQSRWTELFVESLLKILYRIELNSINVDRIFTQLAAVLQNYGVHDYLLPQGIGRAFVSAWVTPGGARWQGDYLYVTYKGEPAFEDAMCATMIRDNIVCLINNQASATKVLASKHLDGTEEERYKKCLAVAEVCVESWDKGIFDYLVVFNTAKRVVVVVEMCKHLHHPLISIHAVNFDAKIGFLWSDEIVEFSNKIKWEGEISPDLMTLYFFPFVKISDVEGRVRDELCWNSFSEWNFEPGEKAVVLEIEGPFEA